MYIPRKFSKKPITVEAMQFNGTVEDYLQILDWIRNSRNVLARYDDHEFRIKGADNFPTMILRTYKGTVEVNSGDWVVPASDGEFYVHDNRSFAEIYDPLEEEEETTTYDQVVFDFASDENNSILASLKDDERKIFEEHARTKYAGLRVGYVFSLMGKPFLEGYHSRDDEVKQLRAELEKYIV